MLIWRKVIGISVLAKNMKMRLGPGGATQQSFIRGGSALRSKVQTHTLLYTILREKVPLSYTFRRQFYPFDIPTERVLLNFSFEKALKILR